MRRPFLMLPFLLFTMMVAGQDVKIDFADGEFFLAMEEYEEALYTFSKVFNNGYKDNANINYRIGICLLQIPGRKTEAIPYLEKAVQSVSERYREGFLSEKSAAPDAHLYLGNAYRINMEFEKACEQYRLYEEYVGTEGNIQTLYADMQITSCSNAVAAINNPVHYSIGNLGQINETHQEVYNMVISQDQQTMAYMGRNPLYRGVYVSRKENGLWTRPQGINPSIASEGNMEVVGLSSDGNTMLLVVSDQFSSNIYKATYENGRWNPAQSLGKPINSRYFESHATFSPDSRSIYFTSNRDKSLGAMDIWRSDLQEDGSWGDPVNLGEKINTPLNEETPMISPDGKRIYFSSQAHDAIGGFDVFYSDLQDDGSWDDAVNLGYPLNTTDDDFTISPTGMKEERTAFIFANGEPDQHPVFKFEIIDPTATPVPVPFEEPVEEVAEVTGEEAAEEAEPEPGPGLTKPPERYLIRPVFFAFDSYALSDSARTKLEEIALLMERFPSLKLEITGHTDAIGTFEYNQRLSENRAEAVAGYLESKGISKERLKEIGKSESENIARNTFENRDAPDGRKLNRRAEFKVSTSGNVIVEMQKIQVPEHLKLND
jgi:outer membrane protein OmpA-like peptidoglycan-associated protein/tetratricopeptide (TPR) repeat protein